MPLRDVIRADRDAVLRLDDFACELDVDGCCVKAQVDSDRLAELAGYSQLSLGLDGVVVYAKTEDLPCRRAPGERMSVDGVLYTVVSWEDECGIAEIALQRPE